MTLRSGVDRVDEVGYNNINRYALFIQKLSCLVTVTPRINATLHSFKTMSGSSLVWGGFRILFRMSQVRALIGDYVSASMKEADPSRRHMLGIRALRVLSV